MLHLIRALLVTASLFAAAMLGDVGIAGQPRVANDGELAADNNVALEVIKTFDFDERPRGNYGSTPMYWDRMGGEGLPRYSAGQLDDDIGHTAPPSFRFDLQGGSIIYEYGLNDLTVLDEDDYFITGQIRAVGLHESHAFIHVYLVDRLHQPIAGSDRLSKLIQSINPPEGDEPWQRVEITMASDFPEAHALWLRLWVLQDHAWRSESTSEVDPIVRQDVRGQVWFDDISVYRLPRVRLGLSEPGGIISVDEPATFELDVRNSTSETLNFHLNITDHDNREVYSTNHEVSPHADTPVHMPVPPLETGQYRAQLQLFAGNTPLHQRSICFAFLPELPPKHINHPDFGVDLGLWLGGGNFVGATRLIKELRCGAVKIGTPIVSNLSADSAVIYFNQIRDLTRALLNERIRTTGVFIQPRESEGTFDSSISPGGIFTAKECETLLGPILAPLGNLMLSWQLGDEQSRLGQDELWEPAKLQELRQKLRQFMTTPNLVLPCSVFDTTVISRDTTESPARYNTAGRPEAISIHIPAHLPTSALPEQLSFLGTRPEEPPGGVPPSERWLMLDSHDRQLPREQRLTDLAQRLILAKVLGPERIYIPAPFAQSTSGGQPDWYPTDEYIILRTLFHFLSGKEIAAVVPVWEQDGILLIFADQESACALVWTWRARPPAEPIGLYLGPEPTLIDLWGRQTVLELQDGRAMVPLSSMPLIIDHIETSLALLQASFLVEPAFVQLHNPEPRPVLRLRNHYERELIGTISFILPEYWCMQPDRISFDLAPGEALQQTLNLELPPRQIAATIPIDVNVELESPITDVLKFEVPITVGLQNIQVDVRTYWEEDGLVVDQVLYNQTSQPVSFSAYCRAPLRSQLEGAFLDVGPGERQIQSYFYPSSRSLAGSSLLVGVREIQGHRSLDQLVEILP